MVADAYQRISTHSEPTTAVIPANAGIQYLGMDSGSPFHSARNDGCVGRLEADADGDIPTPAALLRHSRERGNPVPRHGFRVSASLRPE